MNEIQDFKDYALSSTWEENLCRLGFKPLNDSVPLDFNILQWHSGRKKEKDRITIQTMRFTPGKVYFSLFTWLSRDDTSHYVTHEYCDNAIAYSVARKLIALVSKMPSGSAISKRADLLKIAIKQSKLKRRSKTPRFTPLRP